MVRLSWPDWPEIKIKAVFRLSVRVTLNNAAISPVAIVIRRSRKLLSIIIPNPIPSSIFLVRRTEPYPYPFVRCGRFFNGINPFYLTTSSDLFQHNSHFLQYFDAVGWVFVMLLCCFFFLSVGQWLLRPNTILLHVARSCDSQAASHSVSSIHSVMLSVHLFGGLPLCRTPSTEPAQQYRLYQSIIWHATDMSKNQQLPASYNVHNCFCPVHSLSCSTKC